VQAETFRRDLYYRISTFPIHTPSLAERSDDIPLLAQSFLERIPSVRKLRFSRAGLDHLAAGRYPGNIRELRNVIERATLLADGDEILPANLGLDFASPGQAVAKAGEPASGPSFVVTEQIPLDDLEHRYLVWLEGRLPGNRRGLAARLGISERTLSRKMNRQ
jgi:DNA-binding NtrC family response regulator